jgi:two-component system LytT family response regulator
LIEDLLKPVTAARLREALERVPASRDFVLIDGRVLTLDSIRCIRAAGAYSEIYTADDQVILAARGMKSWQQRLPGDRFLRVHRSAIVNVRFVQRVDDNVILVDAPPIPLSRRCAARLRRWFR